METVEVVIRIDKNTFDAAGMLQEFVDDGYIINGHHMKGSTFGNMIKAIAKGTILPKGHGKIIDSKQFFIALNKYLEERKSFCYADLETVINCCTPPIVKENTYGDS